MDKKLVTTFLVSYHDWTSPVRHLQFFPFDLNHDYSNNGAVRATGAAVPNVLSVSLIVLSHTSNCLCSNVQREVSRL